MSEEANLSKRLGDKEIKRLTRHDRGSWLRGSTMLALDWVGAATGNGTRAWGVVPPFVNGPLPERVSSDP